MPRKAKKLRPKIENPKELRSNSKMGVFKDLTQTFFGGRAFKIGIPFPDFVFMMKVSFSKVTSYVRNLSYS